MRHSFVAVLVALALGACATLSGEPRVDAHDELRHGLVALDSADFTTALDRLVWVYARCGDRITGREALLGLAVAELDPRNPARRVDVAAELLARYLRRPAPDPVLTPAAEALYLLAVERGGHVPGMATAAAAAAAAVPVPGGEDPANGCGGVVRAVPDELPRLTVRTVPALIDALRRESTTVSDSLRARIQALEQTLAEREQELARIRKTIKP